MAWVSSAFRHERMGETDERRIQHLGLGMGRISKPLGKNQRRRLGRNKMLSLGESHTRAHHGQRLPPKSTLAVWATQRGGKTSE